MMNRTPARLQALEQPIRVAIVGAGAMGKGLFYQCFITPGIQCVALADIRLERCIACAETWQVPYRVVSSLDQMHRAIQDGLVAICEDGDLLARCSLADVFLEASSSIIPAAQFALTSLEHQKHLVLMNSEIDLTFGPYLLQQARENGVVFTSCDGDQHGVIGRLVREVELWGLQVVLAGNIKGFLDRYSDPTGIIPEADKRRLDYRMATAYTDGTKLCVEMALVANAFGMMTPIPGMRGPPASSVQEALTLFDLNAARDSARPWVEYVLGAEPGGGVFVIGYCAEEYQRTMLEYFKMGQGPYYLFYRPYHLCHVEAMQCIFEAVLEKRSLLQPDFGFSANVFAYAKRALAQGERLDGVGGYAGYGLIENCVAGEIPRGLPICLAENLTLKRPIARDEKILLEDVEYDSQRADFALYQSALDASTQLRRHPYNFG
jgi:predicted homoserine dehydrogenase-like protein